MPTYIVKRHVGDAFVGCAYTGIMELDERLKLARKRRGLTQQEVADHFGIARVSVTQWEGGTSRPDQSKFVELATLFDVPLKWLMDGTGELPPLDAPPKLPRDYQAPPAPAKFLRSSSIRFYIKEWREFMGASIVQAAKAAGLDEDGYQAFETYPINFTLHQVVNLAEAIGVRGDQFWFPPPKRQAAVERTVSPKARSRSKGR